MKTVLCYGDSNTYGWDPLTGKRYAYDLRWPGKLQCLLGEKYYVVEEGLNGRTVISDELDYTFRNGFKNIETVLRSHMPVNYLVIMLGTNETKTVLNHTVQQIAIGMRILVRKIQEILDGENGETCRILIVAPPWIKKCAAEGPLGEEFDISSAEKSSNLALLYKNEAERMNVDFIDAEKFVETSEEDGIHLMPEAHEKLAQAVKKWVKGGAVE